ncbi:uncharacterized protein LOC127851301 isoform X2 [Dreissena polymorpha]|uniref:uncharacterized protein LOC127851301 isoform X2 n=1 Tax=Dreissena polymorpha TaxID=45954 RepID=UPI0022648BC3|nr:uncharacterized protein LOC127851301 isoform X2 [Dreissena polymorpha]
MHSCLEYVIALVATCFGMSRGVPPPPTWPELYKSCVNVATSREFIKAGWYVDTENRRMRLDSYGIPQGMNASTAELLQYYLSQVEDDDYACEQYGPPIYIFIYRYDLGKMLSIFPAPDPPYRSCRISTLYNKFPSSPLAPEVEFVEESRDNITSFYHWRLIVNEDENLFLSISQHDVTADTFQPPAHVVCT